MAKEMLFKEEPLNNIQWIECAKLKANDYNPNVVMNAELQLLKLSILQNGWIQPVLANTETEGLEIIDGYHRWWLSCNDKQLAERYGFRVPAITFNLTKPERMLLTVRINRAKGNHIAVRMHDLVTTVHKEFGYTKEKIAEQLGAQIQEIDLLLQENVFTKLDIANHKYSRAWVPQP